MGGRGESKSGSVSDQGEKQDLDVLIRSLHFVLFVYVFGTNCQL